nr:GNAT family N-acetyltransferase [Paenibacillus sp. P32E]
MLHSMKTEDGLPRFYIAVQNGSIIGTYALLRNDLISRQDVFPWLACLYVVPEFRGQKMGAELLQHALQKSRELGHDNLYLCTDLDGYYERLGWSHFTNGYIFNGTEMNIYTAPTSTITSIDGYPVIQSLKECPEHRDAFITYISESWPAVKDIVIAQMEGSLSTVDALPLTFLMLRNNRMIGFYQLIEQEYLIRKDLSPWIGPLFIDKNERGQALGAMLLQHARKTAGSRLGVEKVYLTTDHIQYYEKYGFREIGLSLFEWGRPSKIYEHDTLC